MTDQSPAEELTSLLHEHFNLCNQVDQFIPQIAPDICRMLIQEARNLVDTSKPFNPRRVTGLIQAMDFGVEDSPNPACASRKEIRETLEATLFEVITSVRPDLIGIQDLTGCLLQDFTVDNVGNKEDLPQTSAKDFSNSTLFAGTFSRSNLALTHWSESRLDEVEFRFCDLDGASLAGACIEDSRLDHISMHEVNVGSTIFHRTRFEFNKNMHLIVNRDTTFVNCDFIGCNICIVDPDVDLLRKVPLFSHCLFDDCMFHTSSRRWIADSNDCQFICCASYIGVGDNQKVVGRVRSEQTTEEVTNWEIESLVEGDQHD